MSPVHPTLEAAKKEFDEVEKSLVEQLATGRVADWPDYKNVVGRIREVREGRNRTLEILKRVLES